MQHHRHRKFSQSACAAVPGITPAEFPLKAIVRACLASALIIGSSSSAFAFTANVAGGSSVDGDVVSSGTQNVSGTTTNTTINAQGKQQVKSGGESNKTTINSSGMQIVLGGTANETLVINGEQQISDGGVANNTTLSAMAGSYSGGVQTIFNGTANETEINSYAQQVVLSDGVANDTKINSAGQQIVNGGRANNTLINGGVQSLSRDSVATNTTVTNGGKQTVGNLAHSINANINDSGEQFITSGGTSSHAIISDSGIQKVQGLAIDAIVKDRGIQDVQGGVASNTLIETGGLQIIKSNGEAKDITLAGGESIIEASATDLSGVAKVQSGKLSLHRSVTADIEVETDGLVVAHEDLSLGDLKLNGGRVLLSSADDESRNITIDKLSGSGEFELSFYPGEGRTDHITVNEATGNHNVLVHGTGAEPVSGDAYRVIEQLSGDAKFSLANEGGLVDMGTFRYQLAQAQSATNRAPGMLDWYLAPTKSLSTAADAAIAQASVHSLWLAETETLHQRLGELRQSPKDKSGVWMRGWGRQQTIDSGIASKFDQDLSGIQFGADRRLESEQGIWHLGVMGGYTKADRDLISGNGDVDAYSFGAYATYFHPTGSYVDLTARFNRYENDFAITSTDGSHVAGDYKQSGAGISVAAGHTRQLGNGWFVEPSVKLAAGYVNGKDYQTSSGMNVSVDDGTSTTLTVETRLGRQFTFSNDVQLQPYVRLGYLNEFKNRTKVNINGNQFRNDLSGDGVIMGAGVTMDKGNNHSFYADYEALHTSAVKQPWALSVGYRYSW